ncbi:MAG: hypothetical protein ISS01_01120 [Nanoarchaeota archaeon]|nr:hypothetical protein [Nanoarchaeota archaeon]
MKRGIWYSVLFLLLNMSVVAADSSIMNIVLSTEDPTLAFVKALMGMMLITLIYKVFKERWGEEAERQGLVFAIAFTFIAIKMMPDAWTSAFGWVIVLFAPIIIFYSIAGFFYKGEEDKFNWVNLIIAIVATIILFLLVGGTPGFASGLGGLPYVGGAVDEFLGDLNFFLFYGVGDWIMYAILAVILFGLFFLAGKLFGGSSDDSSSGGFSWKGLGWIVGLVLLLLLLSGIGVGGNWFTALIGGLEYLIPFLIGAAIIGMIYLLFKDKDRRDAIFAWIKRNPWWALGLLGLIALGLIIYFFGGNIVSFLGQALPWIALILILLGIGYLLYYYRNQIMNWIRGDNIFVELTHYNPRPAPGAPVIIPHGALGPLRVIQFENADPARWFTINVYRGRSERWRRPLENATLNFTLSAGTGTLNTVTDNTDANGAARVEYTMGAARTYQENFVVNLTHPEINPATMPPIIPYVIRKGTPQLAPDVGLQINGITTNTATVNEGDPINLNVGLVRNGTSGITNNGDGLNAARAEITFTPRDPSIAIAFAQPVTRDTAGGIAAVAPAVGSPAIAAFVITTLAPGTYDFVVVINNLIGFANPANLTGTIIVNSRGASIMNVLAAWAPTTIPPGATTSVGIAVVDAATGVGIPNINVRVYGQRTVAYGSTQVELIPGGRRTNAAGDIVGDILYTPGHAGGPLSETKFIRIVAEDATGRYPTVDSSVQIQVVPGTPLPGLGADYTVL